jgi:hypothetical protein
MPCEGVPFPDFVDTDFSQWSLSQWKVFRSLFQYYHILGVYYHFKMERLEKNYCMLFEQPDMKS